MNYPPLDELKSRFTIKHDIEYGEFLNYPYLAIFYFEPEQKHDIIHYLTIMGFSQVAPYEIECNSFSISFDLENQRAVFDCSSTCEFSGIPRDTPGFIGNFIRECSYPCGWKFGVPIEYTEQVKKTLIQNKWKEIQ